MNKFFRRSVAAGLLAVSVSACSSSSQVRNTSLDECCHLVAADPQPEGGNELVWCDNKGRNDLVDKNAKNDDKGRHICGGSDDSTDSTSPSGSDSTVPAGGTDSDGPGDTSVPGGGSDGDSTSSPDTTAPVTGGPGTTVVATTVPGGEVTPTTAVTAIVEDEAVVVILPVRDVYMRVQPEPETTSDPVTAVVGDSVDTVAVTPEQVTGLVNDSGVEGGRVYVRPVVKNDGATIGLVRETVTGEWEEVNPADGVSVVIGTGAPTVEFQVRPPDGSTEGAVTVAVDVQRADGSGEGTGSGTVTRSFNWWLLLLLLVLVVAAETWRRRRRSSREVG